MLWEQSPADPAGALRDDRFDLRTELGQQVPELGAAKPRRQVRSFIWRDRIKLTRGPSAWKREAHK
jgi:hypothetical protein